MTTAPNPSGVRAKALLALVLVLSVATVVTITVLERRSASTHDAEVKLARVSAALNRLQGDPFTAMPVLGGTAEQARAQSAADMQLITSLLAEIEQDRPPASLQRAAAPLRENFAAIEALLPIASSPTFNTALDPQLYPLLKTSGETSEAVTAQFAQASREYQARAARELSRATLGSALAILGLFLAFALVYRRSLRAHAMAEQLAAENARMADASRHEARTDALTGLRNRRALVDDLADGRAPGRELVLVLFDLDGFKQYNDTFGHPAGDGLLARIGERLQAAVAGVGTAYRLGGDEFCVLAPADVAAATGIVALATEALTERGDAFDIDCSYGVATIDDAAPSLEAALRLADQRMYEHKADRSSAGRQSTDVLLKVLSERNAELAAHLTGVSDLAIRTARQLGLSAADVRQIGVAAELHDIGKTAIPDAILHKPGPLDAGEWDFMRQHTVIGERIVLAAPSLASAAGLVRSSHEAYDGSGYPDGLRGEAIPYGSRIVAVCDAFDAMISKRAYRPAVPIQHALDELRRCAGTQFDAHVVGVFCALIEDDARAARSRPREPVTI